jgi:hypothetical protein
MKRILFDLWELALYLIEPWGGNLGKWLVFWFSVIAGGTSLYFFGGLFFHSYVFQGAIKIILVFAPFVLPVVLLKILFDSYIHYIRAENIVREGSVLLEIKIPKETDKSPLAMEIFLTSLYHTGSVHLVEAFWQGKFRAWFSLEMVSIDGQVHFYIWCWKKWRNLIEAQLYAQYPTIEIYEADDYTKSVHHDPANTQMWGTYFKLEKPDVYPIKTYVDYGLDKLDLKEEFKIDPMTSVLEYLGSMKKGEQVWIQILIQCHRKEKLIDAEFFSLRFLKSLFKAKEDWKAEIDEEIEKIREESLVEEEIGEGIVRRVPHSTPGQIEKIKALERSRGKFPFEVAIRGFYIGKNEAFNPISITGLVGSFRQYNSNNLNGFKLGWYTDPDEPWRDFRRMRRNRMEIEMLEAYKLRSFFRGPFRNFEGKPIILMTEELATIFHLPGSVSQTPTLSRILSKRSEPPSNLPR